MGHSTNLTTEGKEVTRWDVGYKKRGGDPDRAATNTVKGYATLNIKQAICY